MSDLAVMASVFEAVMRLTSAYIAGELKRQEFIEAWMALGCGVELIAKDMDRPISLGRLAASKGGQRGGPARAQSMTPQERTVQARHAAEERWLAASEEVA